ncbi:MAG: LamG-like jellyroll fold domain-containing protein [Phycisphaerae bacterium]
MGYGYLLFYNEDVEWVRPYPRVQIGATWRLALRRQGAAPEVAGDRVLFMPRDAAGLFALDAATGRRLWEAPFIPADQAVGMAGETFVCASRDTLFGVEAATGRVAWHRRLPEAIRDRPSLRGGRVCVTAGARTWWLDATTGDVLASQALPAEADPPLAAACRGEDLVAVSSASADRRDRPAAPGADGRPLALPLGISAAVPRNAPWLWLPPRGEAAPDRLYLESDGVLECVGAEPDLPIRWQRFLAPGVRDVFAAGDVLVLAYDERLLGLDADSGEVRYRLALSLHADRMQQDGTDLAVLGTNGRDRDPWCGVVDLAAGRVRWAHPLPGNLTYERGGTFAIHGDFVHVLGRDRGTWKHLRLRRTDGKSAGLAIMATKDQRPRELLAAGGWAFWVTGDGDLYRLRLDKRGAKPEPLERPSFQRRDRISITPDGPWVRIQAHRHGEPEASRHWVLRTDDPAFLLEREGSGSLRGGVLYTSDAGSLTVLDLASRQEVTYDVPGPRSRDIDQEVFDFHRAGDRTWIVSRRTQDRGHRMVAVRMDVFDAATGRHLDGQVFRDLYPRRRDDEDDEDRRRRGWGPAASDIVWAPKAVFLADARGLHALAAGPSTVRHRYDRVLVARADDPVAVDGRLEDWNAGAALALQDRRGGRGRLHLAHGGDRLWLGVASADASLRPAVGAGDAGGGDRLEVGLTLEDASYRWQVGMDARGRVRCSNLGDRPLPEGLRAAMRHALRRREVVWEVEVPLEKPSPHRPIPTEAGLSLAVWDDSPADGGATRTLAWGDAVGGRTFLAGGHRQLVLRPLTQRANLAMHRIVDAAPSLPEAFAFFEETAEIRARSARDLVGVWGDFIREHPESVTVARLLALDRALRVRGMAEPREAVLAMARDAGVPETVTRRYARQGAAYLSQWVYVPDTRKYPRSIALRLYDGTVRPQGWGPRVYWIKTSWYDEVPSTWRAGRFPAREWHEVRLPLSLLGMADRPVSGIRFRQQGEPPLVWDRSAVVAGEDERVLVDDDLPPGAAVSPTWRWLETPARSGRRSHTGEPPGERYNVVVHEVRGLAPVTVHLEKPEDPPYLSQWVYLDPDRPPTSVSIGLFDGEGWTGHAIWGEPRGRGRYIGPLPAAGTWQELRLPMDWTPLAEAAVEGIYFGTYGGRAVWDRTVLVGRGGERVLVDEAMPPPPDRIPRGWTPWADEAIGGATLVPGKQGMALACDGRTGYVEVPHSPDLEPKHLTIEAWVRLPERPTGYDTRRWLVNKNVHEQTGGHYALLIDRKRAGAYLHIGADEEEGKFEAWDAPETLPLNQWHHLAMTYDGQDLKVYRNGGLVAETRVGRERVPGHTPLAIGRRQDGYSYFKGHLDGICFWKRALSAEEIRARVEADGAPPPADAPSLVAHWGFDDEATPAGPAADWQWVEAPVKHGRRAHAHAPADGWAGHCAYLAEPVRSHLPYDPRKVVAALRKHVPDLGPTETAWRMFACMRRLTPSPAERVDLCRWFLRHLPNHPQAERALGLLHAAYVAAGEAEPAAAVDRDLARFDLPREIAYEYRRKHVHPERHYIRTWQVLGPLPGYGGGGGEGLPPGGENGEKSQAEPIAVNLEGTYDGREGPVRWRPFASETGFIDVHKAVTLPANAGAPPTDYLEDATAYAVCWVHSETPQRAFLHVIHNDGARVWLNGRLAFESEMPGGVCEDEDEGAVVNLPAGWSRLLVYSVNTTRRWWFAVELMEPHGRGPAPGLEFRATPPEGDG